MKFAVLSRKETQKKKNLSYRKPTLSQFNFCFNLKKFGWDFLSLGKHNSSDNRKCVCVYFRRTRFLLVVDVLVAHDFDGYLLWTQFLRAIPADDFYKSTGCGRFLRILCSHLIYVIFANRVKSFYYFVEKWFERPYFTVRSTLPAIELNHFSKYLHPLKHLL